jgi:hypothetical protein
MYSVHFVGQNGPTEEHLDPVSAITSTENNNPNLCLAYKNVTLKCVRYVKDIYKLLDFACHILTSDI